MADADQSAEGQVRQLGPCSTQGCPGLHLGNAFFSGCCPGAGLLDFPGG